MPQITPSLVKQLREQTGAGMMDCKRALEENDGDLDAATDWLRKKGLAAAAKKAGRIAAEGLVGMKLDGPRGVLVEVNSETDFVARNETFQKLVRSVTEVAFQARGDVEALRRTVLPSGHPVAEELQQAVGVIGEHLSVRRTTVLEVSQGVIAGYIHNGVAPGLGKIGVLVALQSAANPEKLAELGRHLAMHVAAAAPQALDPSGIPPATLERERAIFADQARASGKPESIIAKMVEGRIRKFYEESVFVEQVYVVDTEKRVKEVIEAAAKEFGMPVHVTGFERMVLGEGIEREETDLAAEVAKLTQG